MRGLRSRVAVVLLVFALADCGGATPTTPPSSPSPAPTAPPPTNGASPPPIPTDTPRRTFPAIGKFVGSVAQGPLACPRIAPDPDSPWAWGTGWSYELVLPRDWSAEFDPIRIYRPDGSLAASEGDVVEVTGEIPMQSGGFCGGPRIIATEIVALPSG